jgi:hypothetical protein
MLEIFFEYELMIPQCAKLVFFVLSLSLSSSQVRRDTLREITLFQINSFRGEDSSDSICKRI